MSEKDLVKREAAELAASEFVDHAGEGLEGTDSECFAVPYLVVLQKLSPQLDKRNAKYVADAEEGFFYNTATQAVYDGAAGVRLLQVGFTRMFVEWLPREDGGGFRGAHLPASEIVCCAKPTTGGKLLTERGTLLADTRYHFCIQILDEVTTPVVVALSSTQIRNSKQLTTLLRELKMRGPKGIFRPPAWSLILKATSIQVSNDKGSWMGWKFERDRFLNLGDEFEAECYLAATEFSKQVKSGNVQAGPPDEAEPTVDSGM